MSIVIQIEESLLRGRRKYKRLLLGDRHHEKVQDNLADFNSNSDQENYSTLNRNYGC